MRIDPELIRKLLLQIEGNDIDLSSYTNDQVLYHKAYLCEKKLADGLIHYPSTTHTEIPDLVRIKKLTPSGHDFIDSIRDEHKWTAVKDWLKNTAKTVTIELIKQAVLEQIK
jgi:hypothetical protein